MTQEERKRVWPVYEAACDLPVDQRAAFVEEALAEEELRDKVFQLLATSEEPLDTDSPGEGPPHGEWERIGQSLGRFHLLAPVGRGGMGEVYEAFDPDLGRRVAVKCISSRRLEVASAVEALTREARAASALNHPGIVTIFEVIRTSDTVGIVMELVEGEPLRKLTGTPHPASQVALWGQRIAEALAATHERGIIHRDIKPENLVLRGDGYVKVLDFGLAAEDTIRPVGTLRYMSPEQSTANTLTPATDIFSLGIVLYELATGVHPFAPAGADTSTLTVLTQAAMAETRPPSAIQRGLPKEFESLLLQMLEKDPSARPSAEEVARRLAGVPTTRSRGRQRLTVLAVTAALAAACAIWAFSTAAPKSAEFQGLLLTGSPGDEGEPAFSPDSQSVVYSWDGGSGGKRDIWVKPLHAGDSRRLTTDPADESDPCWLADGSAVAFLRQAPVGYQIVAAPIARGAERAITTISNTQGWIDRRLACSPVDAQLVVSDDPPGQPGNQHLYAVSFSSGERRVLTEPPPQRFDFWPRVSPDGRWVAFVRGGDAFDLRVVPFGGGESISLAKTQHFGGLAWSHDSKNVIYQLGSVDPKNVWQVAIQGGAPVRPAFRLVPNAHDIAISVDGQKIAYDLGTRAINLWRIFVNGQPSVELAPSTRPDTDGAWSADGKRIVFASDRSGRVQLWVASADGINVRVLTNLKGGGGSPAWSPDGRWIAFDTSYEGPTWIAIVSSDGGAVKRLLSDRGDDFVPSWSHDGKWIYFCSGRSGTQQIWRAPSTGGSAVQITRAGGFESHESPDGHFLYYDKWGAKGIWRIPLTGNSAEEEKVSEFDPAVQFRCWDVGTQGIYIGLPGSKPRIALQPFTGATRTVAALPADFPKSGRCFAVHPDGQSFLFPVADADRSEIYVGDYPAIR